MRPPVSRFLAVGKDTRDVDIIQSIERVSINLTPCRGTIASRTAAWSTPAILIVEGRITAVVGYLHHLVEELQRVCRCSVATAREHLIIQISEWTCNLVDIHTGLRYFLKPIIRIISIKPKSRPVMYAVELDKFLPEEEIIIGP